MFLKGQVYMGGISEWCTSIMLDCNSPRISRFNSGLITELYIFVDTILLSRKTTFLQVKNLKLILV